MTTNTNLEIYNETNTTIENIDFLKLKNLVLGESFDLTVSILLPKNSLRVNKKQRKQSYVPNTLSFKYAENSGEIILTPEIISEETYQLGDKELTDLNQKIIYLTIHSMLHLKDLDHGDEMEKLELKYFQNTTK